MEEIQDNSNKYENNIYKINFEYKESDISKLNWESVIAVIAEIVDSKMNELNYIELSKSSVFEDESNANSIITQGIVCNKRH